MKVFKRHSGVSDYISKKITRRYLRRISKQYINTRQQLATMSFDCISQSISVDGRYENDELTLIEKTFKDRLNNKVILDIGANIGNHTVAFSKISKKVFAFEPNNFLFELLEINTRQSKNIEIFNFGASDRNQSKIAKIPKLNWGGGSLVQDEINSKPTNTSLETKAYEIVGMEVLFKLKALDSIMSLHKINIGMIKIDIEGHELHAFRGMKSLLIKNKPIILFEQNRGVFNQTSEEIKFLKLLGYKYLYEFNKTDDWITPNFLPGTFKSIFKFLEVLIFGEPLSKLSLNRIARLEKESYNLLIFSCDPL